MPDPGYLAGDLYNALSARGISASRVNYLIGGGWRMRLVRRGGLIRGQPRIACDTHSFAPAITVSVRRLWGSKPLATIPLEHVESADELADRILKLFGVNSGKHQRPNAQRDHGEMRDESGPGDDRGAS